jgi:Tetratricopeptide repeat
VNEALRAWFAGDFEGCLTLCDSARRRDPHTLANLPLVRARAYLRLGQPQRAIDALQEYALAFPLEESITARMLLGEAYLRAGDLERGASILEPLDIEAETRRAHPSIRSEIAVARALYYFQLRNYDAAEAVLDHVLPSTDIIYARALEYRGWIATARTAYDRATAHFKQALSHLDKCRHADRFVEANCLHALASLAGERLDIETANFVRERAARVDWSASGLSTARFWISFYSTYALESLGRTLDAADAARAADALAPSEAYRVQARLRRASIARNAGDTAVAVYDHTRSALELYQAIESHQLEGDERLVPLLLADHLSATGDLATAEQLLAEYRGHRSASTLLIATGDARVAAFERLVEAQIAEAARDMGAANRAYLEAYRAFKRLTYSRRAAIAALRLAAGGNEDALYDEVDLLTKHLPDSSFLRKEVARRRAEDTTRHLTPVEREVLRLLCAGLSPKEIAAHLNAR